MKSHTDLPQSKKLVEILPIESADMWYHGHYSPWKSERKYDDMPCPFHSMLPNWDKPCWSLAALLDVIPKKINFGYENYSTFNLKPLENGKYLADYYEVSFVKDNPVDACYEMIMTLKEKDLL